MNHPSTHPPRGSRRTVPALALLGSLVLYGCGGGGAPPGTPAPENPMLPLAAGAVLYYDDRGGISDSVRIVVRDEAQWAEAWQRATSRRSEPPPRPSVDFQDHMVLVVGAGRMTPGDRIQVDSAGVRTERTTEDEEEVVEVIVRTVRGCGQVRADIFPLAIVRIPFFDGRVSFVERVAEDCNGEP